MNVLMWCNANAQMQAKHLGCYIFKKKLEHYITQKIFFDKHKFHMDM
jgi:hypothetical protein